MTDKQRTTILEAEKSLGQSFPNYAGQWVAVRDHAVVEPRRVSMGCWGA